MSEIVIPTKEMDSDLQPINGIIPSHEQDYWETWAEVLPAPKGTIYDSESYNKWWNEEKIARRQQNVAIATGRVNGKFMKHGTPR